MGNQCGGKQCAVGRTLGQSADFTWKLAAPYAVTSSADTNEKVTKIEWQVAPAYAVEKKKERATEWQAADSYDQTDDVIADGVIVEVDCRTEREASEFIVEVDYSIVREDLMKLMESPNWDDGSYAPILIRLAWHSSGTYCASSSTGGSFGGTMRHPLEAGDPDNAGLGVARQLLEPIVQKYKSVSTADIWILAAYCAIEHTGGPCIPFRHGRMDVSANMAIAPGRLPKPELGVANDLDVDEEGRIKGWQKCAAHIRQAFNRMGLSDREIVALICGGHAYGRRHPENSGYAGACVQNPTRFSNGHAAALLSHEWMLITSETKMPDGRPLPDDVRPAPGKRQYIDATQYKQTRADALGVEPTEAKGFRPGKYRCRSEWVHCRENVDISSPIIGFISKGQEINVVEVKLFGMAIRGLAERGGWISVIASTGDTLFDLMGDIDVSNLAGRYRAVDVVPYFETTNAAGIGNGKVWQDEFHVSSVRCGSYEGRDGALFGNVKNGDGSWALLYAPRRGLLAELVVPGYNDQPRCPLRGQSGNQTMLISDMVMLWDPAFRAILEEYAADQNLLSIDFCGAFKRLTELGCPWSKDFRSCLFACSRQVS